VYVNSQMRAAPWMYPNDSPLFELLWVHVRAGACDVIVGALYHPPKPLYQTSELLNHIEVSVDAVESAFPAALVILAGDFNTLSEDDVIARSALCSIVDQPTRGANKLDRICVSKPCYTSIKVVAPTDKSDHKAVIAHTGPALTTISKSLLHYISNTSRVTYRRRSPNQHALFLKHLPHLDFTIDASDSDSVQSNFDEFYQNMQCFLDQFYPQRTVTIMSTDPDFTTPTIKAQL